MRREFFKLLYDEMNTNPAIWLLVGDLGYGGADKIRKDFPERFINYGASEFAMVCGAVGLALEGKIPVCYTITPFYFRAFEVIRNYIDHEQVPVILIGAGRDRDYEHDGFSHYAGDDGVFRQFKNIQCCWPGDTDEMTLTFQAAIRAKMPYYINLTRG